MKLSMIKKKKVTFKTEIFAIELFYYILLWIKFKFKIIYFLNVLFYKGSMSILKIMCNLIITSHNFSKNFRYKELLFFMETTSDYRNFTTFYLG